MKNENSADEGEGDLTPWESQRGLTLKNYAKVDGRLKNWSRNEDLAVSRKTLSSLSFLKRSDESDLDGYYFLFCMIKKLAFLVMFGKV